MSAWRCVNDSAGRCAEPAPASGLAAGQLTRAFLSPTTSKGGCSNTKRGSSKGTRALGVEIGLHAGERRRPPVDLPSQPVHTPAPRLREASEPAWIRLLPRSARHARHARVRHVLRDDATAACGDRSRSGDESHDGGLILETGISAAKLHRIPIGIDTAAFRPRTPASRAAARHALGLPESAFVLGSFQKDGVGWGDGLEPKLIKGPDVLLGVASRLRERVPEIVFLLTGPSRGYVRAGLEQLGIPCRHVLLPDIDAVAQAYEAIDLCMVTSRDEGGRAPFSRPWRRGCRS